MKTTNLETFDRLESEVRGYIRSFPVIFERASGAILTDTTGREYIDFFSGAGTLNYGHSNPVLRRRLIEYIESEGLVHGLDMATVAKKEFMESMEQVILVPRKLNYKMQFTGPTGTNAVEAALKLARQNKKRANIICFTNAFHGVTGGSLAATGNAKFREASGVSLGNTTFMPYDGYLGPRTSSIDYLERTISDSSSGVDAPAAAIVETVQGEGGINVASDEWLRALESLCRRHDMLLIVDDIQAGCGRTGSFFSFEQSGIFPDIVTLSKSLSGFGLPMSLVLMKPEVDIWKPGAHSGTFRGNNLAFVTATAALEHYWSGDEFAQSIRVKAGMVRKALERMARSYSDGAFSVRGRGLIQGLVSETPGLSRKIAARAFDNGMVIETSGAEDQVVKLLPPLTIDMAALNRGLEIIKKSVCDALGQPIKQQSKIRLLWNRRSS